MIPAHKAILAGGSPVFWSMFYGPMKETGDVKIADASPTAFRKFLDFFYNPNATLSTDDIGDIIILAHKYDTEVCFSSCVERLNETEIVIENVCEMIRYVILFDLKELAKKVHQFVIGNTNRIFKSKSFLCCNETVLGYILRMDRLGCQSEIDVFEAVMMWAANVRKEFDSTGGVGSERRDVELRNQLTGYFYLVRFPTMNTQHFLQKVKNKYPNLFTETECLELLEYMIIKTPLKTLSKFSTKKRIYDATAPKRAKPN